MCGLEYGGCYARKGQIETGREVCYIFRYVNSDIPIFKNKLIF